jgi:hypothetical protein
MAQIPIDHWHAEISASSPPVKAVLGQDPAPERWLAALGLPTGLQQTGHGRRLPASRQTRRLTPGVERPQLWLRLGINKLSVPDSTSASDLRWLLHTAHALLQ